MSKKENEELKAVMFQDETDPVKRQAMLDTNCLEKEERPVKHYYDEVAISEMRKEYSDNAVKIFKALEELAEAKARIKGIVKPLIEQNNYLLRNIREGYNEIEEEVYMFDFQEIGMMAFYDKNGELVDSRRLKPDEKQTNVVSMSRKAGNG